MEQERRRRRPAAPAVPPEQTTAPPPERAGGGSTGVQVIWGAMTETFDLAETTVGDAYRMLRGPFHIAPAVTALVNGLPSDADRRLAVGDVLEFARPAGEKGART